MSIVINLEREYAEDLLPGLKNKTGRDPGTRPQNGYSIELISGNEVFDLLLNPEFQADWDSLYESCSWATAFQSRQFVTGWYQVYKEVHLPILIKATEGGRLSGLLAMTLLSNPKRITGAGHFDAVCQTWLAIPSDRELFIKKALTVLMKRFPGIPVTFRYLPPGTPVNWIKTNKQWGRLSIIQPYSRPLINLKDEELPKMLKKNHFKSKFNRLKKAGEVSFECIRDLESFETSLAEIAAMYDFRQGALFNKNHFRNDPLKKHFLLEMFRLQLLHVSVLKVNETIMAAVASVTGKHNVHLSGFICHSPFGSKFNSPGYLHFILLSKQLAEEGFQHFDLTPGYDTYKEQYANLHDEVHEWVICNKLTFRIKRRIRTWIHSRLVSAGIRPMTAELKLKKKFYLVRNWGIPSLFKKLIQYVFKKNKQHLYLIPAEKLSKPGLPIALQKNSLGDLLKFENKKGTGLTRWEFLSDAMLRLGKGDHCFTWTEDNRLLGCAWLNNPGTFAAQKDNHAPNDTILLQGVYYHSTGKNRLRPFLETVALVVGGNDEKASIQFIAEEKLVCRTLETAGFHLVNSSPATISE